MLNAKAFGLSVGILWGLTIFGTTLLSAATGFGKAMLDVFGSIHPGYSINYIGAFVGLLYAFVCAALGAYIVAWIYNKLEKRFG